MRDPQWCAGGDDMESASPVALIIISGGIGLAAYCFVCAIDVWRRRNRRGSSEQSGQKHARSLCRVAYAVCGLGFVGMAGALVMHLFVRWEGILEGEQLFVVTKPREELLLQHTATGDEVEEGAVVARFSPVEREAERPNATVQYGRRSSERPLSRQRFLADSQIGRELQQAAARQLELEMAIKDVVLEVSRLKRTTLEEALLKKNEIDKVEIDRQQTGRELHQATVRLAFKRSQAERQRLLHSQQLISAEQLQEATQEVELRESEVAKLQERFKHLDALRSSIERGLETMQIANRSHERALQEQLDKLRAQLADAQAGRRTLVAFVETMNVVAPFSGRIVYRDPSPQTVPPNAPIMIIAPRDGLRVKIRMPGGEMGHLQSAETLHFRLPAAYQVSREDRKFIERLFPGRLLGWKALPYDPDFVLAEFAAEPPPEAVREMVSRRQVVARLLWVPPLLSIPAFVVGANMAGVGCVGVLLLQILPRWGASRRSFPSNHLPPAVTTNGVAHDGAALRALGVDLRDLIRRRQMDGRTLAAAECALERHQVRACRLLSVGLGFDSTIATQLQDWAHDLISGAVSSPHEDDHETFISFQRLIRLLLEIVNEQYQPLIRRLELATTAQVHSERLPRRS
jgi:hypothetical protein